MRRDKSRSRPPQPPRPRGQIAVVAHRGASGEVPEHTLAAYRRAIDDGADALECDVRMTADGHLVCVHDRRVNRTSNGRGAVSALELTELAELDFGSWKRARAPDEGTDQYELPESEDADRTAVLTLDRLLRLVTEVDRPVGLAIETKHPTRWAGQVEEQLLRLLAKHRPSTPVRIMSFSARSLNRVCSAEPSLPTVFLTQVLLPRLRDGRLPQGATIAGPSIRLLRAHPGYVERAHSAGHEVHVWTVNDPVDVELCARLGVDAMITNHPSRVRTQLTGGTA